MQFRYRLGQPILDESATSDVLCLVEFEAPVADAARERPPAHIIIVLDRSASMAGRPLGIAKLAIRRLFQHLEANDLISVVTFSHDAEVLAERVSAADKEHLWARLQQLEPDSVTNLSAGWLLASSIALKHVAGHNQRIVLLTDGKANAGLSDPGRLAEMTAGLFASGIPTTTIGIGQHYNEDLIEPMARSGGGNFHHLDGIDGAESAFLTEFGELAQLYAQNVAVRIAAGANVLGVDVLHAYPTHDDGAGITVSIGDVFAGETRPLLIRFRCQPGHGTAAISNLTLTYHQVLHEVALRELTAFVEVGYGQPDPQKPMDPIVEQHFIICETNQVRERVMDDLKAGDISHARASLRDRLNLLRKTGYQREADELEAVDQRLDDEEEVSRKMLRMQWGKTRRNRPM
jgi:Ca-activated chloride channel homolog